jgi:dTDP-4-amino-4,6-dideoxygalactose transaminase
MNVEWAPTTERTRILLSPPHMSGREMEYVHQAFESNWIAPLGPHVDAFENEFARKVGARHAAALSSGTAGLHLAMILLGVSPGDEVFVSDLTFSASVNPIIYCGARPVFIDSEKRSWNMDPQLLAEALAASDKRRELPKAGTCVAGGPSSPFSARPRCSGTSCPASR